MAVSGCKWLEGVGLGKNSCERCSAAAGVGLHFAAQDLVHVRLVPFPLAAKPGEHVGIHAEAHQLLDWPVETPDLDVRGPWISFGNIGKIDLRIGQSCDAP